MNRAKGTLAKVQNPFTVARCLRFSPSAIEAAAKLLARTLSRHLAASSDAGIASGLAARVDAAIEGVAESRHRPPLAVTGIWHDALPEAQDAVGGRCASFEACSASAVSIGLTGPMRPTHPEPFNSLQPLATPSSHPLTRSVALLLATCRLLAASWNDVAHRGRRSIVAADRLRGVAACGDACANDRLDFEAALASFCCFGCLASARGRLASSLNGLRKTPLFAPVVGAIAAGLGRSQTSLGHCWTRHSACPFALCGV